MIFGNAKQNAVCPLALLRSPRYMRLQAGPLPGRHTLLHNNLIYVGMGQWLQPQALESVTYKLCPLDRGLTLSLSFLIC